MKRTLAILMLSAVAPLYGQGTDAPVRPEKHQDPEAMKLLERFDSLLYVPRAEGLKDVEFRTRLPNGLDLVVWWKAPDKVASDLEVPPDTPERNQQPLKLIIPAFRAEAAKHAPSFAKVVVGESLHDQHADDDVTLVAPNKVKIVARSDRSKEMFAEQTLTFDESGLVKEAAVTAPTGLVSKLEPTFVPWSGKNLYKSVTTTIGKDVQTVEFTHEKVDSFIFVKKMSTKSTSGGRTTEGALELREYKANTGLDDKIFERTER